MATRRRGVLLSADAIDFPEPQNPGATSTLSVGDGIHFLRFRYCGRASHARSEADSESVVQEFAIAYLAHLIPPIGQVRTILGVHLLVVFGIIPRKHLPGTCKSDHLQHQ